MPLIPSRSAYSRFTYIGTAGKAGNHTMKFTLTHVHRNSATDRTQTLTRLGAGLLSALLLVTATLPGVAALSSSGPSTSAEALGGTHIEATDKNLADESPADDPREITIPATIVSARGILSPADPESMTAELTETLARGEDPRSDHTPQAPASDSISDENTHEPSEDPVEETDPLPSSPTVDLYDPSLPLTQELIAQRIEARMDKQVRGGSKIYYPWPSGAMAVDLYKDGRQILKGQVADVGGTVYVPVQRFADLFGSFRTVYTEATEQVVITGTNLSITVKVGDPYITVNERIFYTGKKVISLGGWIFVPLTSMCKALNATVTIRSGYYDAFITSGDTTKVKWASEFYNSTDLYWLSRIISAEARGEPFSGQIAVGNVVLNRVRSSQFPNTVKGVIFDTKYGTQFSPVASGTIYNTPTASAVMAAKICLEGFSLSTQMIYFYNPSLATSSWIGRTRPYIMTIGNHKFYG